jgi:hypothetical protein
VVEVVDEAKQEKSDVTLRHTPTEHLPDSHRLKSAPPDWKVTPLLVLPPKQTVEYKVRWGPPGSESFIRKPKAIPSELLQRQRNLIETHIKDHPVQAASKRSEQPGSSGSKPKTGDGDTAQAASKSERKAKSSDSEKKRKRSPSPAPDKTKKRKTAESASK